MARDALDGAVKDAVDALDGAAKDTVGVVGVGMWGGSCAMRGGDVGMLGNPSPLRAGVGTLGNPSPLRVGVGTRGTRSPTRAVRGPRSSSSPLRPMGGVGTSARRREGTRSGDAAGTRRRRWTTGTTTARPWRVSELPPPSTLAGFVSSFARSRSLADRVSSLAWRERGRRSNAHDCGTVPSYTLKGRLAPTRRSCHAVVEEDSPITGSVDAPAGRRGWPRLGQVSQEARRGTSARIWAARGSCGDVLDMVAFARCIRSVARVVSPRTQTVQARLAVGGWGEKDNESSSTLESQSQNHSQKHRILPPKTPA